MIYTYTIDPFKVYHQFKNIDEFLKYVPSNMFVKKFGRDFIVLDNVNMCIIDTMFSIEFKDAELTNFFNSELLNFKNMLRINNLKKILNNY
jgi:hypothetical protein